jgi:hypothetical protein
VNDRPRLVLGDGDLGDARFVAQLWKRLCQEGWLPPQLSLWAFGKMCAECVIRGDNPGALLRHMIENEKWPAKMDEESEGAEVETVKQIIATRTAVGRAYRGDFTADLPAEVEDKLKNTPKGTREWLDAQETAAAYRVGKTHQGRTVAYLIYSWGSSYVDRKFPTPEALAREYQSLAYNAMKWVVRGARAESGDRLPWPAFLEERALEPAMEIARTAVRFGVWWEGVRLRDFTRDEATHAMRCLSAPSWVKGLPPIERLATVADTPHFEELAMLDRALISPMGSFERKARVWALREHLKKRGLLPKLGQALPLTWQAFEKLVMVATEEIDHRSCRTALLQWIEENTPLSPLPPT